LLYVIEGSIFRWLASKKSGMQLGYMPSRCLPFATIIFDRFQAMFMFSKVIRNCRWA